MRNNDQASLVGQLESMTLGECRWIGREDVHVYCFGSRDDGRYDAKQKRFKVVTEKCDVWSRDGWLTANDAATMIATAAQRRES